MKTKLTVTIDDELLPKAKDHARSLGVSLSQLIERALRDMSEAERPSFSERWRGKLRAANRADGADRKDERHRRLAEKYL